MRLAIKAIQDSQQVAVSQKNRLSAYLKSVEGLQLSDYHRNLIIAQLRACDQVLGILRLRMEAVRGQKEES